MNLHEIKAKKRRQDVQVGDRVEIRAKAYYPSHVGKIGTIVRMESRQYINVQLDPTEHQLEHDLQGDLLTGLYWSEMRPVE